MRGFVALAARESDDDTNEAEHLSLSGHMAGFQELGGVPKFIRLRVCELFPARGFGDGY